MAKFGLAYNSYDFCHMKRGQKRSAIPKPYLPNKFAQKHAM